MATEWYYNNIGKHLKYGFFIEIGVFNGKTQNTTLVLENSGWDGLLVEPMPENIQKIKKNNRRAKLIEGAVWSSDGMVEMIDVGIPGQTGIKQTHKSPEEAKRIIKVVSYKFSSLPIPKHIDYLQIDTEGSELEILKTIDLNEYNINHICIEDNNGHYYDDPTYHNFMSSIGYNLVYTKQQDRVYQKV